MPIKSDTIAEYTAAAGVTIDGILIKDGGITEKNVFNVLTYGSVGDGVADDTAALQAAVDAAKGLDSFASEVTGAVVYIPAGVYRLTTTLDLTSNTGVSLWGAGKTKSNLWFDTPNDSSTAGTISGSSPTLVVVSATGFAEGDTIRVLGAGVAGVDLVTTIDDIAGTTFTLHANASTAVTAHPVFHEEVFLDFSNSNNYRGSVRGLGIRGATSSFAHTAIEIGSAGNQIYVDDCWLSNFNIGIHGYPTSDSNITGNVFEYVASPVRLANSNDILIANNMFYECGPIALGGVGTWQASFDLDTCTRVQIIGNRFVHANPVSAQTAYIHIGGCTDVQICNNVEFKDSVLVTEATVVIDDGSERITVSDNQWGQAYYRAIKVTGASHDVIVANNILGGTLTAAYYVIHILGASYNIALHGNIVQPNTQDFDMYCQEYCHDITMSGNTFGSLVEFANTEYGVLLDKSNSFGGGLIFCSTNAPSSRTWRIGDVVWATAPASGQPPGWVCTESGTISAATDSTGDTDGSTAVITGMTDTSDFNLGDYVDVSAGFAATGPYKVLAKTASSLTLSVNSNAVASNITVDTSAPVWTAMANLA